MNSDTEEKQKIASSQVKKKQGIKLQVCSAIMGWMNPNLSKILLPH